MREKERKKKRKRKSMIAERVTNADPSNREKIGEKLHSNGKENKKNVEPFFSKLVRQKRDMSFSFVILRERKRDEFYKPYSIN